MKKLIFVLLALLALSLSTSVFATCSADGFTYYDEVCEDCGIFFLPWTWSMGVEITNYYEIQETPSGYCVTVTTDTYTGLCGDC